MLLWLHHWFSEVDNSEEFLLSNTFLNVGFTIFYIEHDNAACIINSESKTSFYFMLTLKLINVVFISQQTCLFRCWWFCRCDSGIDLLVYNLSLSLWIHAGAVVFAIDWPSETYRSALNKVRLILNETVSLLQSLSLSHCLSINHLVYLSQQPHRV